MLLLSLNPPSVYPCAIRCRRGFYSFLRNWAQRLVLLVASGLDDAD